MNRLLIIVFMLWAMLYSVVSNGRLKGQLFIDSLLTELPKQKADTDKVKIVGSVAKVYLNMDLDKALKFARQALELAEQIQWKKGIASANSVLGTYHSSRSEYAEALTCYQKARGLYEEIGDKIDYAVVTGNIGNVYDAQSDYVRALEYNLKALNINENLGNKRGMMIALGNIGLIYDERGDYVKALEYYFKNLRLGEETGEKEAMAASIGNIGGIYEHQHDYAKALEYYLKALKVDEEISANDFAAMVTGNIGNVYTARHEYASALEYYTKALKMYQETEDKSGVANVNGSIGNVYMSQHDYPRALPYHFKVVQAAREISEKSLEAQGLGVIAEDYQIIATDTSAAAAISNVQRQQIQSASGILIPSGKTALLRKSVEYAGDAISIDREIGALDDLSLNYYRLFRADSMLGDYKGALLAQSQFIIYKDSVFSKENAKKMMHTQMQYEFDLQHMADSLKNVEKERINKLSIQRQRTYLWIGAGVILMLISFSFFMIRNNKLLGKEKDRSEDLLLNILPVEVAHELMTTGTSTPKHFDDVTVFFTDFVNFTTTSEKMRPKALIDELHACFKAFDEITARYNIEKIKTIGDAYLGVCGLPLPDPDHAKKIVQAAIEITRFMEERYARLGENTFRLRVGIHSGSVVAGIVGVKKFAYDIWGDTVNTAARMEQNSEAGKINISQSTYELVKHSFTTEYRGEIEAKNKGKLKMYFIT